MFKYSESEIIQQVYKLNKAAKRLINETDLESFYEDYRLNIEVTDNRTTPKGRMLVHCINWLYTVKCETRLSGIDFIHHVLKRLNLTMKRELTELQFEYVRAMAHIFLQQRNLYIC